MYVERVSIVIPAFNAERWVSRAIDSALVQDWPDVEVIVINDGSTDDTERVCLSYGGRIRYCRQENQGVSAARNTGIEMATGELIGFLDADDELLPHMVSTLAQALRVFKEAGAASAAHIVRLGSAEERCPPEGVVLGAGRKAGLVNDFFIVYARWPVVCTGAVLVRRRVFEQVGLFRRDLRLGEDIEMWTRIAGSFPWVFVDEVVAYYNRSPESSVTLKPLRKLDFSFLYDEEEMHKYIRAELWPSYRIFRREQTLHRCRSLLRYGATREVRAALSRIPPAGITGALVAFRVLAVMPPWIVKPGSHAVIGLKRVSRAGIRWLRRLVTKVRS